MSDYPEKDLERIEKSWRPQPEQGNVYPEAPPATTNENPPPASDDDD